MDKYDAQTSMINIGDLILVLEIGGMAMVMAALCLDSPLPALILMVLNMGVAVRFWTHYDNVRKFIADLPSIS